MNIRLSAGRKVSVGQVRKKALERECHMNGDKRELYEKIAERLGDDPEARLDELMVSDLIVTAFRRYTDSHHGLSSPSKNISEGLRCVTSVYSSDISFLIIVDDDIKAFRIIAAEFRNGLEGFGSILLNKIIGANLFRKLILPGNEYCLTADFIKDEHPEEYEWMRSNGVEDFMLTPLKSRTRLIAFVGTCNARRLKTDMTMLRLSQAMLKQEMRGIMVMGNITLEQNRFSALEDNDVVINMFGGFEIRTFLGSLDLSSLAPTKCCLMLVYLLFNSKRTVSVRELAEVLWPDQLFDNPGTMVKGVAFRLRKLLTPICEKSLILAKQGTYVINDELVIIEDMLNFDFACSQLEKPDLSTHDRQLLYELAISIYKGNLLPNFEDEIWLVGQMSHYQIKYWQLVKEYLVFLEEAGQYESFFATASRAMNIVYPDGEIYFMMIRVMLKQGRQDLAKNCYLRVEKLFTPEQKQYFLNAWHKLRS